MGRWWSRGTPSEEEALQLPADPASWSLGEEAQRGQVLALLAQELKSTISSRRVRAIELLVEAPADEAIPALRELLRGEDQLVVRWKALWALQQLAGTALETREEPSGKEIQDWRAEVVAELMDELDSERPSQRWGAAEALGLLGDPESIPSLVSKLRDPHAFVRWAAAQALGKIGSYKAVSLLLPMLKENDPLVRRSAVDALAHLDTPAVRHSLRAVLHDPDPTVRRNAIEAIARLGDAEAVEALTASLGSENDFWVRYSAAEALGTVGNERAVASLVEATGDRQALIRRVAVRSLGMIQSSQAIPVLVQALKDPDAQVRLHAAEGLGRIGHEGVIAHLKALTADTASVFGHRVAEAAQAAIAAIQERIPRPHQGGRY